MNQKVSHEFVYGRHRVVLETGHIAKQATAAVLVRMGHLEHMGRAASDVSETVVLVTVMVSSENSDQDFFPLTVLYQEKSYAAGRIPGSYFKREGRPSEIEILRSRLIDRPIRPMFPESCRKEVQIVATVMSLDPSIDADIPSMLGASAALAISGLPFPDPMAAVRVGYDGQQWVLNPYSCGPEADLMDLVVASTKHSILMIESGMKELPASLVLDATLFAHQTCQVAIDHIQAFREKVREVSGDIKESLEQEAPDVQVDLASEILKDWSKDIEQAYQIKQKSKRLHALKTVRDHVQHRYPDTQEAVIKQAFEEAQRRWVRKRILTEGIRADGRKTTDIRPITIETSVFNRLHGSALFTRGETQAFVALTLGKDRDAQMIEHLAEGSIQERFMLHYNFPPYAVGEIGPMSGPKRREIGHGCLAKRALISVLPDAQSFNYTIRLVSEITESNGSSSMATVCGGTMALMDGGVPIRAPVAGIAMGLITDDTQNRYAILSDISGDEDHLGDMDFKVAGTRKGMTALQMDVKICGFKPSMMHGAVDQACHGLDHILSIMDGALQAPRAEVSSHAPRVVTMKVPQDKIREIIGKGGSMIKSIIAESGASIDISDDGTVKIASSKPESLEIAQMLIKQIAIELEVGKVYAGTVARIVDFGAFVTIAPGRDGLLHVSQIIHGHLEHPSKVLQEGQKVKVLLVEVDRQNRMRLSMKDIDQH